MKKRTVRLMAVIALLVGGIGVYLSVVKSEKPMSSLVMANIEALALDGEKPVTVPCVTDEKKECSFEFRTEDGAEGQTTLKKARNTGN
ncbi:NVEALA domain-containing protein [Bacteroides fragilis]|uniref:NVEALA domain-containing protein n=1 Tax=Bacteroides fragilis TaxID=817 RepID=UPI0018AF7E22|nr:NVEALA domain-containing protein [Bacteroides fragilis]MCE8974769.1 NVEALA domain-containing protein [Bacteroides fragilis]